MPVTLVKSKWSSGNLIFYPATDDTGAINIGDGTNDCDFKIFLGDTSTYVDFNVGDGAMNITAALTMGASVADGVTLTDASTVLAAMYGDIEVDGTASTVINNLYSSFYISTAQTNDWDFYAVRGHVTAAKDTADGLHGGVWGQYEYSGTVAVTETSESVAAGVIAEIKSDNDLTLGTGAVAAGLLVDGAVGATATNNGELSGIYVKKQSGTLDFEHGITIENCVSAGIFNFPDGSVGTIISDSNDAAFGTATGYITNVVGGNTRVIPFRDDAPS